MLYKKLFKPIIDKVAASFLLILLSPLLMLTMLFLTITNRGQVFFFQLRPGLYGIPFRIIKFKTMKDVFDESGKQLPDELRLTKVGQFIRSCSLDELLQLVNVIKGDMSIVGPRPLLMQYLNLYTEEQASRHSVKPGITGWAQVNGRNSISWDEKFRLDIEYVKKQSFLFDVKILFKTVINVLKMQDISANGRATIDEFNGKN